MSSRNRVRSRDKDRFPLDRGPHTFPEAVLCHQVIDEGHLPRERLEPLDNPVAGVFQLEQSQGVEEIRRIIDSLLDILGDPELRELRQDMATWLRRAVLPARLPGIEIPELQDLQEAKIMLAERAARWPKQWMAEGYEKGLKEGRQEGRQAALLEGQRLALSEQVGERFGPLEPRYEGMIAAASEAQLKQWRKDILSATDLSDLFPG